MLVDVHVDPTDFESCVAHLPAGLAGLTPYARGHLVLDVVYGALLRLGQARGWDAAALEAARRHTVDHGLAFTWSSPWKANPGRALQARSVHRLDDDGYARVRVEVEERSTGRPLGATLEMIGFSTFEGIKRSAKTLHWAGPEAISIHPYIDLLGQSAGESRFGLGDLHAVNVDPPDIGELAALAVTVRGYGAAAPEQQPAIVVVGGGPMNGVPRAYRDALDALLSTIESEWTEWWSGAEPTLLEITYIFGDVPKGVLVRVNGNWVTARIKRPTKSMATGRAAAQQAREDVRALMAKVATRLGLGAHPPLG